MKRKRRFSTLLIFSVIIVLTIGVSQKKVSAQDEKPTITANTSVTSDSASGDQYEISTPAKGFTETELPEIENNVTPTLAVWIYEPGEEQRPPTGAAPETSTPTPGTSEAAPTPGENGLSCPPASDGNEDGGAGCPANTEPTISPAPDDEGLAAQLPDAEQSDQADPGDVAAEQDDICLNETVDDQERSNLIIQFTPESFAAILSSGLFFNIPVVSIEELNSVVVSVTQAESKALLEVLGSDPQVVFVEPDAEIAALDLIPNDPGLMYQNYLDNIDAFRGWDLSTGSTSTVIAILDTGINLDHPDLDGKLLQGIDLVNNTDTPQDDNGHGTRVAGIASAESNNRLGISGVNWNAMLLPVKVLDSSGNGSFATVAQGIIWAVDHGSNIINLSLGGSKPSSLLQAAIEYAAEHNVMVIASSGNNSASSVLYPANYDSVIAVGATTDQDQRATFSNYGSGLDVVAPGVGIYSTTLGGNYGIGSGTSFSTPMVSGLAAILCGIIPLCPIDQVEAAIFNSAVDLGAPGWDPFYGWGLIQVDGAIQYALNHITPTITPTPIVTPTATYEPVLDPTVFPTITPTQKSTVGMYRTATPIPLTIMPGSDLFAPTSNPDADLSIAGLLNTPTSTPTGNVIVTKTSVADEDISNSDSEDSPVVWSNKRLILPVSLLVVIVIAFLLWSKFKSVER